MAELDIARIKRNVGKMIDQGAPEGDIDTYVASEGASPEMLRSGVSAKAEDKKPADTELDLSKQGNALKHGLTSAVAGYGETAKQFLGMKDAGNAANDWAARNAPTNYDPAFNKVKEGDLTAIPRAAVEAAPGLATDVAASTLGGKLGGAFGAKGRLAGAALAGITSYLGRTAGSRAKETAAEQGNNEDPTTAQKAQGAATALGEAAVNQLGLKLGVMGGGRIASTGTRGVLDAAGALARRGATEGASNVAQDAVGQLGTTAGSDEGARIKDPASLVASGLTGAALGTAMSTPRATRDVAGAVRERGTDTEAATRVSNRIVTRAGSPEALSDPKLAFETVSRVKADIGTELGDAAKNAALSPDAQNALNAARSGKALSDTDLAHIDSASDPQLSALARDANEVTRLTDRGQFANGKFEGGVTAAAKKVVLSHPFLTLGALGGTAGGATLGVPTMLAGAAKAAPALAGLWAAGRGLDHMTGMRSPARSYTEKFADGGATRVPPAMAPQPQPGPTQGAFPGGAPVAPGQGPWGRAPQPATVPNVAAAPAPQPGIAQPPPGFANLLQTAVMTINKGQKQQAQAAKQQGQQTVMQAMPLLRQLAAQNGPKQQASIDKMSTGIDQGIAALVQQRPQAPLGLPAPQPAMPMGAPAPQLALPAPSRPQLPATLSRVPGQPPMTPPPGVIQLPGAPGAPPAAPQPEPARQAALAKQIADLHNEEVRRARVQAALAKAPAKPAPVEAPAPKAAPIVEAMKPSVQDDGGIPDFLKRTRDAPKGPLAEALSKKTLLETAFKDAPAEASPYTGFKHDLGNGKTFDMFPPHKEFANAHTLTVPEIVKQITTRRNDAGELMFPSRRYADAIRPRIQGKRDLAYALADVVGVPKQELDKHLQAIPPSDKKGAERELQRIKDTWPKKAKQIDKVLTTSGLNGQEALTLWGRLKSEK